MKPAGPRVCGWWIATVLAVLGLAGCGQRQTPMPGPENASPSPGRQIEFWHIQTYDPTGPAVAAAVQRAAADRPGLRIRAEAIKNDPFKEKLATAMGAGAPPDIFHTWGGGKLAGYVAAGRVLELSDLADDARRRLHPAALGFCSVDDKLYALPVDVSVVPMWYNKELFARAGVEPPRTMEEFREVCSRLKAAGIVPVALGNAKGWPGAFYFVYLATRAGAEIALAEGRFDDQAFIDAGAWIQQAVKDGIFNEGYNGLDHDDARRLFFSERAAMMLMGTWLVAQVKGEAPEFEAKLGVFAFPGLGRDPQWDATVVGGVNAGYAIAAGTPHREDCLSLLKRLTDETAMREWAATGRIPSLSEDEARRVLGEPPAYAQFFFAAPRLQLYYDQYLPDALALAHKETTQALFALTVSPAEAAQKMVDTAAHGP